MGPLSTFFVRAGFWAVGEIGFWLGTRAGTRPAPTGAFEGKGGDGAGGGRRQGQGRHLRGFGGAGGVGWGSSVGWALGQCWHQVDEACCWGGRCGGGTAVVSSQ